VQASGLVLSGACRAAKTWLKGLEAGLAETHGLAEEEARSLRQALEDRKLIERAKGAVMRLNGVDEGEASRRLKKLASLGNRKLAEIARDVLAADEVFWKLEVG
jgi:AmiR/NasT family two-component response regulator